MDSRTQEEQDLGGLESLCGTCHHIYADAVACLSDAGDMESSGRIEARCSRNLVIPDVGSVCSLCPLLRDISGQLFTLQIHGRTFKSSLLTQWRKDRKGDSAQVLAEASGPTDSDYGWAVSPRTASSEHCRTGCRCTSFDAVDWDMLKSCLRSCVPAAHQSCHETTGTMINSLRVIDCDTRKLVILESPCQRYATLSYVWGKYVAAPHDNSDNGGLLAVPDRVPRLIEDAIHATRSLGLRYLWIDRYCIDQHDPGEKHFLIRNMGHIYANSCLTIITSCSDDPSQGISGISESRKIRNVKIGVHYVTASTASPLAVAQEVANSRWNTRGWTYQESLLARKRLVFTNTQAYFQCYQMHRCETLGAQDPQMLSSHTTILSQTVFPEEGIGQDPYAVCLRIVEYCRRHLTFDTDRLDAFQGVLRIFSDRFNMGSLSGLPIFPTTQCRPESQGNDEPGFSQFLEWKKENTHNLVMSLGWAYDSSGHPVRRQSLPSWSWVGWEFPDGVHGFHIKGYNAYKDNSMARTDIELTMPTAFDRVFLSQCAQIEVEFDDRTRLPLNLSKNNILCYARVNSSPKFLLIRSWVAPVQLPDSKWTGYMISSHEGHPNTPDPRRRNHKKYVRLGLLGRGWTGPFFETDEHHGVAEFATAVNQDQGGGHPSSLTPDILAVVMSANDVEVVALLVTQKVGTDHFEFCGVRRFLNSDHRHVVPVNDEQCMSGKTFQHQGIDFELRDIRIG